MGGGVATPSTRSREDNFTQVFVTKKGVETIATVVNICVEINQ